MILQFGYKKQILTDENGIQLAFKQLMPMNTTAKA
jgi:hypothetical protein